MLKRLEAFLWYVRSGRNDPQYTALAGIVAEKGNRLTVVTQFRGSRKSFLASKLCDQHSKYIYISNHLEFERLIKLGRLRRSRVLFSELKHYSLEMCLLVALVAVWNLCSLYKEVRESLRMWYTGQETDLTPAWETIRESRKKILASIWEEFSVFSVAATGIMTFFVVIRVFARRTIILDDVLEFSSQRDSVQTMLSTAVSLANHHRVVLLSSNEGIVKCFRDRCSSVYDERMLPIPTPAAVASILNEIVPDRAMTLEAVDELKTHLPEHLALSIRFHMGARKKSFLPALIEGAPLSFADTCALFETVMEIDLESDENFRSFALAHSPPYKPSSGVGIQTPGKKEVPRRLIVTCAVVDLCQRLEQRCIFKDICDVLKTTILMARKRCSDCSVLYVPTVAEERRHSEQLMLLREQLMLQREQMVLQREQMMAEERRHSEQLTTQREQSVVYWVVKGTRAIYAAVAPHAEPVAPATTGPPIITPPPEPSRTVTPPPEPSRPLSPCNEALLRLESVFPRGTPVLDTLHEAAKKLLCEKAAAAQSVSDAFAIVFDALSELEPVLAVQVASRCRHCGPRLSLEQEKKLEWYVEQWTRRSPNDVMEPTFPWSLLSELHANDEEEREWGLRVLVLVDQQIKQKREGAAGAAGEELQWLRRAATPLWTALRHEYTLSVNHCM